MSRMEHYNRGHLPSGVFWGEYRKRPLTRMTRIQGPFMVDTREGTLTCQDGWLAIDSAGWPYPIPADEQADIYDLVKEEGDGGDGYGPFGKRVGVDLADLEKARDALVAACRFFAERDRMNAAVHLGDARWSPLTALVEAEADRMKGIVDRAKN